MVEVAVLTADATAVGREETERNEEEAGCHDNDDDGHEAGTLGVEEDPPNHPECDCKGGKEEPRKQKAVGRATE